MTKLTSNVNVTMLPKPKPKPASRKPAAKKTEGKTEDDVICDAPPACPLL